MYSQYGRAKTKQAQSSKPKNANQQAARTMGSVGVGGLGGRTTTSAAQKIQDNFRREHKEIVVVRMMKYHKL